MKSKKIAMWFLAVAVLCSGLVAMGCSVRAEAQPANQPKITPPNVTQGVAQGAVVYMTDKITPEGLLAVYNALGLEASGKVAVKISTGEPGNPHFLSASLIKNLVQKVNGTIVECNTAYGGKRANTAMHYQVAKDHGFTAIAPVVIMDEKTEISIPVTGGKHFKKKIVGARFKGTNFHNVSSHF